MRLNSSSNMGKSAVRIAVAAFLASAATGCSSDATRFAGIFDKDNLTTASIPKRQGAGAYGVAPVPEENVGNGGYQAAAPANQPYRASPAYGNGGGYAAASPVRAASSAPIQRAELAAPSAQSLPPVGEPQTRREAMAQPMPSQPSAQPIVAARAPKNLAADDVVTNTTPSAGWSVMNAPKVTLRPGETAATLSRRYGVPEGEILKANNGRLTAGQIVVIPTYASGGNAAKRAAGAIDLPNGGNLPQPVPPNGQKVAVLPSAGNLRDKAQGEAAKLTPPAGGGSADGTYTVKAGDTLAKVARATGTPIDQLKAMNNLKDGGLRVGQSLKVGAGGDTVKTASIPGQPAVASKAEAAAAQIEAAQPKAEEKPAATQTASLSDVKMDNSTPAPSATGIGKYRWPVTGAVIAAFGQNVNGSRNDGIDISVPEGTPIKAAENGVVIYAGNGLKQLGNTVLVRHDDGKVTVYGHAANISVSRGQKVQRGQTIATSGMSGDAKRPQVHFEVRKDASPVNPVTFLE
ncbi:peptidoglycan DD-metalloendopeptidase family protein [Rhizobium helianthi]|uniref:Peptidoglycan DD-metalloendopeptidase family protein n=1 Tax=Rhizobium helianthi TaxID=1132695 RepID=A0ABW4M113_9HYPH